MIDEFEKKSGLGPALEHYQLINISSNKYSS
jgi:hypothetical protein